MNQKIPVPTDNIYKFCATFGLVVMVVSLTLMIVNVNTANQVIFDSAKNYYDLRSQEGPFIDEREKLIDHQLKIAVNNRDFGKWGLAFIFLMGFFCSCFGFYSWLRKLQPIHDEILELQRRKLELEVRLLKQSKRKIHFNRRRI
ncbi:hypothetical protein [Vreelandella sp. EE27]